MISLHTPYHKARYLITLGLVHHGHTGGHINGGLLCVGQLDAGLLSDGLAGHTGQEDWPEGRDDCYVCQEL